MATNVPNLDLNAPLNIDTEVESNEHILEEKVNKRNYRFGLFGFLTIIVATLLVSFLVSTIDQPSNKVEPIQTSMTEEVEVEKQILDKTKFTFEVLNGSGVAGQARKTSEELTNMGYKVIKQGNALENVSVTELYLSSTLVPDKELILNDLKTIFSNIKYAGELDAGADVSVRLIVSK